MIIYNYYYYFQNGTIFNHNMDGYHEGNVSYA